MGYFCRSEDYYLESSVGRERANTDSCPNCQEQKRMYKGSSEDQKLRKGCKKPGRRCGKNDSIKLVSPHKALLLCSHLLTTSITSRLSTLPLWERNVDGIASCMEKYFDWAKKQTETTPTQNKNKNKKTGDTKQRNIIQQKIKQTNKSSQVSKPQPKRRLQRSFYQ